MIIFSIFFFVRDTIFSLLVPRGKKRSFRTELASDVPWRGYKNCSQNLSYMYIKKLDRYASRFVNPRYDIPSLRKVVADRGQIAILTVLWFLLIFPSSGAE